MSGESAYDEAHRLRHANIELNFDLDAAKKRIEALEEQSRIDHSQRLGLEAAADRYLERAQEGQRSFQVAVADSLEWQIKFQDAVKRLGELYAYADRAEHGCLRWEDPLPVPTWVDDIRKILAGEITVEVTGEQVPTDSDRAAAKALGMDPIAVSFIVDVWARESGILKRAQRKERAKGQCRRVYQLNEHTRAACLRDYGHTGEHDHMGEGT